VRVKLQPAYVLHSRPYRDSSLLLEVFTVEQGRVPLVVKGARRKRRGGSQIALLQPFVPLLLSFTGRGELRNLSQCEAAGSPMRMRGDRLFSALYVNELLVRMLHRNDPHSRLFANYTQVLATLAGGDDVEECLRRFELGLLDELGYGFSLSVDGLNNAPLRPEASYSYQQDYGLVENHAGVRESALLSGEHLLSMSRGELGGDVRVTARRLLRQVLSGHLGGQPLRSRELFAASLKPSPAARQHGSEQEFIQGEDH
jgi:DNA repair protein RecO (recombination protein O)